MPGSEAGDPSRSLAPALELLAAWTYAEGEPAFYWSAVERVMGDVTAPESRPEALAELIFGLSSLGGLLLRQLADSRGQEPAAALRGLGLAIDGG